MNWGDDQLKKIQANEILPIFTDSVQVLIAKPKTWILSCRKPNNQPIQVL